MKLSTAVIPVVLLLPPLLLHAATLEEAIETCGNKKGNAKSCCTLLLDDSDEIQQCVKEADKKRSGSSATQTSPASTTRPAPKPPMRAAARDDSPAVSDDTPSSPPPTKPTAKSSPANDKPDAKYRAPNVTLWFDSRFPTGAESVSIPDDSEASRQAALVRLRSTPPREVCKDTSKAIMPYGTACSSHEFAARPILEAPKIQWMVKLGWWGAWSPFLIGDRILTGSCTNEDNKGLSALDKRTGKTIWRVSKICTEGKRGGSMGHAAFSELGPDTALFQHRRDDGTPFRVDYNVIDTRTGKYLHTLKPVKTGSIYQRDNIYPHDNTFMVVTHSTQEKTTYLNGLNQDMSKVLWRVEEFRARCEDKLSGCPETFSEGAYYDGIKFYSIDAKDQPYPPTRQLHAIEVKTGKILWKHTDQVVYREGLQKQEDGVVRVTRYRSDDNSPMVADGKVIIRVDGLLGKTGLAGVHSSYAIRALDARTGRILWTTDSIPAYFNKEWSPGSGVKFQKLGNHIAAGEMLIAEVIGYGKFRELWGYRLADGKLMWRRPVPLATVLTASAGGVFYTAQDEKNDRKNELVIFKGMDAKTGTLLWTANLPGHNLPFTNEWDIYRTGGSLLQGPSWRIDRDGAIYGVTLTGAYKLH